MDSASSLSYACETQLRQLLRSQSQQSDENEFRQFAEITISNCDLTKLYLLHSSPYRRLVFPILFYLKSITIRKSELPVIIQSCAEQDNIGTDPINGSAQRITLHLP